MSPVNTVACDYVSPHDPHVWTTCHDDQDSREWKCPGVTWKTDEAVNHPAHYGGEDNPYEVIKVIEAWDLGFHLGNTVKYIARAGKKDDAVQDLKKARWYLERRIEQLEGR